MLYKAKLSQALDQKREQFQRYSSATGDHYQRYRQAMLQLAYSESWDRDSRLANADPAGARPTADFTMHPEMLVRFGQRWTNHQQARAWAEHIEGITTLAVDGSHIHPWRDASLPVALIQVGVFENPHRPQTPYLKDAIVEVLPPEEIATLSGEHNPYSEQAVNLRRYCLEVKTLVQAIERLARTGMSSHSYPPVVFFDGSLIVSFALTMSPHFRQSYIQAALSLLAASERARIPIIAYIDSSHARDLTTMLQILAGLEETDKVLDAQLFSGLLQWGDRSPAFLCARGDVLNSYVNTQTGEDYRHKVAFVYLQTTASHPPARLEFPSWLLESGQLERVLDIVRAEVIAGNGYPYAIEAADAVAVISAADREQFYSAFQEFAQKQGLPLQFSSKVLSKSRRRTRGSV